MLSARSLLRAQLGGAQQTRGRNRQLGGSVYGAVWGCECWGCRASPVSCKPCVVQALCRASPVSCKPGQGRALTGYPEGETHLAAQTPLFRGFEPCNPPGVLSARLGGGRNRRVGATPSSLRARCSSTTRASSPSPTLEHYELRNELRYEQSIRNALRAS